MKLKNNEDLRFEYTTKANILIQLVKPKNLYVVAGRATSKSMDILARRITDMARCMPRAKAAITADTYVNLKTNVLPQLIAGWEKEGIYEGLDFVIGEPPPDGWKKPIYRPVTYKHTLLFRNGFILIFKSLDRASINAGDSYVHMFGDEAKFMQWNKLKTAIPAIRGSRAHYDHHYFGGQTFTTDMPNIHNGQDAWILDMEDRMDKAQIRLIAQASIIENELKMELLDAIKSGAHEKKVLNIQRNIDRWSERLAVIREGSTLFLTVSTLVNLERLGIEYLMEQFETLGEEEFNSAILSFKPKLEKKARFYPNLSRKNFFADGFNYQRLDEVGYENITSAELRHCQTTRPLEAGFDYGNMVSLVTGQTYFDRARLRRKALKEFYTLPPLHLRELADQFIQFFKPHKRKELQLWVDRSTHNYKKVNADVASELKSYLEYNIDGSPTGWEVTIMNEGQRDIFHNEEYRLAKVMMEGKDERYPVIEIDEYNCPCLKSSLEMAPLKLDSKGQLKKDKSSEHYALSRLPKESTNFSDAFKYFICRKEELDRLSDQHEESFDLVEFRD